MVKASKISSIEIIETNQDLAFSMKSDLEKKGAVIELEGIDWNDNERNVGVSNPEDPVVEEFLLNRYNCLSIDDFPFID